MCVAISCAIITRVPAATSVEPSRGAVVSPGPARSVHSRALHRHAILARLYCLAKRCRPRLHVSHHAGRASRHRSLWGVARSQSTDKAGQQTVPACRQGRGEGERALEMDLAFGGVPADFLSARGDARRPQQRALCLNLRNQRNQSAQSISGLCVSICARGAGHSIHVECSVARRSIHNPSLQPEFARDFARVPLLPCPISASLARRHKPRLTRDSAGER